MKFNYRHSGDDNLEIQPQIDIQEDSSIHSLQ